MNPDTQPSLTVIFVTPDSFATISRSVEAHQAQTVRDQIELVIVASSKQQLALPDEVAATFCSVRIVEVGEIRTLAAARVAGIHVATAPLVALAEDHAFPEPTWAECLIRAHRDDWAAVGPAFVNGNPGLLSWIGLVMDYGRWIDPTPGGPTTDVPGHNCAWKRALLLEYGESLERMMKAPTLLHWALIAQGHRIFMEPAAKVRHANISRLGSFILDHFYGAQMFAAARTETWPLARRWFYAVFVPLFTLRRLLEWLGHIRRIGLQRELVLKGWPVLLFSSLVCGCGELAGYLLGMQKAEQKVLKYDARRGPYFANRERRQFAAY